MYSYFKLICLYLKSSVVIIILRQRNMREHDAVQSKFKMASRTQPKKRCVFEREVTQSLLDLPFGTLNTYD